MCKKRKKLYSEGSVVGVARAVKSEAKVTGANQSGHEDHAAEEGAPVEL